MFAYESLVWSTFWLARLSGDCEAKSLGFIDLSSVKKAPPSMMSSLVPLLGDAPVNVYIGDCWLTYKFILLFGLRWNCD